jgi:predicted GNAT family acetyltransferase
MPEYRGRGIATQVINGVLEENKGRRVHLQTVRENPARELYQRLGFRKYGETETHWLMEVLPEVGSEKSKKTT